MSSITLWQVYAKRHGRWLSVGDSCTEEEARNRVAELRQIVTDFNRKKLTLPLGAKALLQEAHCVPV
jgi:hypothetical protein